MDVLWKKEESSLSLRDICLVRKVTIYNLLFSLPEHSSGSANVVTPALGIGYHVHLLDF